MGGGDGEGGEEVEGRVGGVKAASLYAQVDSVLFDKGSSRVGHFGTPANTIWWIVVDIVPACKSTERHTAWRHEEFTVMVVVYGPP